MQRRSQEKQLAGLLFGDGCRARRQGPVLSAVFWNALRADFEAGVDFPPGQQ